MRQLSLQLQLCCMWVLSYPLVIKAIHPTEIKNGLFLDNRYTKGCVFPHRLAGELDLTEDELERVSKYLCLPEDLDDITISNQTLFNRNRGIPLGVRCTPTQWCDSGACTTVCKRGTLHVDEWVKRAHKLQNKLSASLPLCYASWLGSHNSAITLADGYGNLDPVYQSMFDYVKRIIPSGSSSLLRTNDHYFSLTDQLNMGVRVLEIDTHWVEGCLRVAHCGGLHVEALNDIVKALNVIAKLIGHHIRWDTETVGCDPSLSSIPPGVQRTLVDALTEIRTWMQLHENRDEFVIVFFDDQRNLETWGMVPHLIKDILDVFPEKEIFTAEKLNGYKDWPSAQKMLEAGSRVLFVSGTDYGEKMYPLVFPRGKKMCNWFEPPLRQFQGPPVCNVKTKRGFVGFFTGSIIRSPSCELQYGPLNCDFVWKSDNSPIFDESSLENAVECGMNVPSPDLLTPSRSASAIWTWAPGYPMLENLLEDQCAFISSTDGRWRTTDCDMDSMPIACRLGDGTASSQTIWILRSNNLEKCPNGTLFDVPRHPKENLELVKRIRETHFPGAWLPLKGPNFEIHDVPTR